MHLDKDYVIHEGEIVIVDEFTGGMMPGRRYSDGLHQAYRGEGKRTGAQRKQNAGNNYLPELLQYKYAKKCGMTGTAKTEEEEFRNIYGMDVVEIPQTALYRERIWMMLCIVPRRANSARW